ncbi:hypothetical protein [Amycolatopsis sp. NBC_01286]|uniref:hypothetical protein n=1 Tax=Amycolatopsis sp. NBC_01286 TaxID=2903560 RepID=UPI002E0E7F7B|nr:hypothetical protein OG570_42270 [Amycolatopsis sp. NBC_01286]
MAAAMIAAPAASAAPSSFRTSFETTDPAPTWENTLDRRQAQTFPWRQETRVFTPAQNGTYKYFKLDLAAAPGAAKTSVAEVELLGHR